MWPKDQFNEREPAPLRQRSQESRIALVERGTLRMNLPAGDEWVEGTIIENSSTGGRGKPSRRGDCWRYTRVAERVAKKSAGCRLPAGTNGPGDAARAAWSTMAGTPTDTAKYGHPPEQPAWPERRFNAVRPAADRGVDTATIMRINGAQTTPGPAVPGDP